jgi:hypothetical protein
MNNIFARESDPESYADTRSLATNSDYKINTDSLKDGNETGITSAQAELGGQIGGAAIGIAGDVIGGAMQNKSIEQAQGTARAMDARDTKYLNRLNSKRNSLREREMRVTEKRAKLNQTRQKFQLHYDRLVEEYKKQFNASNAFNEASSQLISAFKNKEQRNAVLNMWSRS